MTLPHNENGGNRNGQPQAGASQTPHRNRMGLPFIGRSRQLFPNKKEPRIVFLQGPVGSFFRRAQQFMNAQGFDCWRICFNAGDRHFSPKEKVMHFSGSAEEWRHWFDGLIRENGFDAVVLFGADRLIHRVARECARLHCIPVLCLEEGYIRTGFVTMEFGGNNWQSPLAGKLPPEKEQISRKELPKGLSFTSSFSAMAWNAFRYFTLRGLISTPGERKLFHKKKRALHSEAFYWFRNYYWKFMHVTRNYKISERLLEYHDRRYFLVPLQVRDDTQLGEAANSWNNQKLILKTIVSFARNAPEDMQLVFKIHPMERGHTRDWNFIKQVAVLNQVANRVHVLDGGSLGLLTRHAAGMITINSTSGLSALFHGVPLAVMGQALYRHPKLVFCVDKGIDLDHFWTEGFVADEDLRERYLSWIQRECLVPGDFYAKEGIGPAIEALHARLTAALEHKRGSMEAEIINADFGRQP